MLFHPFPTDLTRKPQWKRFCSDADLWPSHVSSRKPQLYSGNLQDAICTLFLCASQFPFSCRMETGASDIWSETLPRLHLSPPPRHSTPLHSTCLSSQQFPQFIVLDAKSQSTPKVWESKAGLNALESCSHQKSEQKTNHWGFKAKMWCWGEESLNQLKKEEAQIIKYECLKLSKIKIKNLGTDLW